MVTHVRDLCPPTGWCRVVTVHRFRPRPLRRGLRRTKGGKRGRGEPGEEGAGGTKCMPRTARSQLRTLPQNFVSYNRRFQQGHQVAPRPSASTNLEPICYSTVKGAFRQRRTPKPAASTLRGAVRGGRTRGKVAKYTWRRGQENPHGDRTSQRLHPRASA